VTNFKFKLYLSYLVILFATACIDRFYYPLEKTVSQGVSVSGFISNQAGPYEVRVYSIFDIESKESTKTPVTVKNLEISDDLGNAETLTEINPGVYQTKPLGIRGRVGGVYKLKIELYNGTTYESLPDTILPTGSLDSLYYNFTAKYNDIGVKKYGVDVFFNSSYEAKGSNQFLWKFTGTFKADTQPENYNGKACFYLDEIAKCNLKPPCSGYRNVGTITLPRFEKRYPCTCCICWYSVYNDYIMISDDLFTAQGRLQNVYAQSLPLNQWTLLYKIRIDMSQMSLTHNSFRFWKAIKDQKAAIGSLFQPITGRIPNNFIQIAGSPTPIEGLFYATAISSKVQYIKQFDLPPDMVYQISLETPLFPDDCRLLFPYSTNFKPSYWVD
jgi:hypothetical protein